MKHLFIPYPLAVIAKEKGFDEPCFAYYTKMKDWMLKDTLKGNKSPWLEYDCGDNMMLKTVTDSSGDNLYRTDAFVKNSKFTKAVTNVAAPLYQQILSWLQAEHRIMICHIPYTSGNHKYEIWKWNTERVLWEQYKMRIETIDEAIEESFKLI